MDLYKKDIKFIINSDDISEPTVSQSNNKVIDEIIRKMEGIPLAKIELNGYASSDGSAETNMTISEKRAASVARVLASRGIDPKRIKCNPKGETELKEEETGPKKSKQLEGQRAENRRVNARIYFTFKEMSYSERIKLRGKRALSHNVKGLENLERTLQIYEEKIRRNEEIFKKLTKEDSWQYSGAAYADNLSGFDETTERIKNIKEKIDKLQKALESGEGDVLKVLKEIDRELADSKRYFKEQIPLYERRLRLAREKKSKAPDSLQDIYKQLIEDCEFHIELFNRRIMED